MKVIRQWKRDQSVNVMELEAAAENLIQNNRITNRRQALPDLVKRLRDGETFETRLATFYAEC